jgi:hypothetical protein
MATRCRGASVSNLLSMGVPVPSVADATDNPVLRDQGPDRAAGDGKADAGGERTTGNVTVASWSRSWPTPISETP